MPKTKTKTVQPFLSQLIAEGKPIGGVKGYIRANKGKGRNCLFIPVEIVGITQDEDECSVKILASPGKGIIGNPFPIAPCEFYLDKKEIEVRLDEEDRLRKAQTQFKGVCQAHSVTYAKSRMMDIVHSITSPESMKKVIAEATSHGADLDKLSTLQGRQMIEAIARIAAQEKYNLTNEQTEELSRHG
jgi:hypothetical protein